MTGPPIHWTVISSLSPGSSSSQHQDPEHFPFPATANAPLQRIRSTSTPNVHMVSTTTPLDSSLIQVGVEGAVTGNHKAEGEPFLLASTSLRLLSLFFQLAAQSFNAEGEPPATCALSPPASYLPPLTSSSQPQLLVVEVAVMVCPGGAPARLVCPRGGSPHIPSPPQNSGRGRPWLMTRRKW